MRRSPGVDPVAAQDEVVADRQVGVEVALTGEHLACVLRVDRRVVDDLRDGDLEQVAGQRLGPVLGDWYVSVAVRVGEVEQPVGGRLVEPLRVLVEVDPPGRAVGGVGEPVLDVHPPCVAGLRVRADQQHRHGRAHPVVDVGVAAQEVERRVVLPGEPSLALAFALHEQHAVGDLPGDRVAQLDLAVDAGIGLTLVPDKTHLVHPGVDERDCAVARVRALVNLLHRRPLPHAESIKLSESVARPAGDGNTPRNR